MNIQDLTRTELLNLILTCETENTALLALDGLSRKIKLEKIDAKRAVEIYSMIAGMKKEFNQYIPENTCIKALELIKDLHGETKEQIYKKLASVAINTKSEIVAIDSLLILNEFVNKENVASISEAIKSVAIGSDSVKVSVKALEILYKLFEKFEETKFFKLSIIWEIFCRSENLKVKHFAFLNLAKENFFENQDFLDYRHFRSEILHRLESFKKAGDTY
jgi:hypothetical protein